MSDTRNEPRISPRSVLRFAGTGARSIIWLVLPGIICLELFAWLLPQDFTNEGPWYIRFATAAFFLRAFQLHIGLSVAALVPLAMLARAWRGAGVAAMLAFTLLLPFGREFAPRHPPAMAGKTLRIMSINLWVANRDETAILRAIEQADPDILVLAEVTRWSRIQIMQDKLQAKYPYFQPNYFEGGADVLSRVPLRVDPSVQPAGAMFPKKPIVFTIQGREFGLYPVHLVSPGRPWLVKYNRRQVESFRQIAALDPRPLMIVGDFNFTPLTPNFAKLREAGFRTSHELAGQGLGNTWGPKWWPLLNRLPGVRIDHLFMTPELTATSHYVGLDTGSDHRPIVTDIGFAAPGER